MAIIIRHGANGSYKSAIIVFNHIVKALKEGRVVVTNMEGMYPLEEISEKLSYDFPESAKLFRIGSLTASQKLLWQNWFCWMPLQCTIVIDEVQSIYKKSFKGGLPLRPIEDFQEQLPPSLVEFFHEQKTVIKADDFDSGDVDDTGILRFNDDGSIIYPDTLEDSFERHRKYNWDIVFGTPDIKQVASNIRACAETAFAQRSRDSFIFTKRNPRIYEHDPNVNGTSPKKEDCSGMKVPLWVFLCYKSTQTGKQTKSGQGSSPFKSVKFLGIMGVCFVSISYFIYSMFTIFGDDQTPVNEVSKGSAVSVAYAEAVDQTKAPILSVNQPFNKDNPLSVKAFSSVHSSNVLYQNATTGNRNNGIIMPFKAKTFYLSGYIGNSIFLFNVTNDRGDIYQVTNKELELVGWRSTMEKKGIVKVKNVYNKDVFYCIIDPHLNIKDEVRQHTELTNTAQSSERVDIVGNEVKKDKFFSAVSG